MRNLRLKFVLITMSMLTAMVLVLLVIGERYDKYWDEYDTYRIVKLVAANGYVKENTDEAIAFVTIDENDKPDIQVNNTFLTNKEVKEVSKDLLNRGKKSWKWHDYIYSLKEKKDGTWQLVFIDFSSYSASYAQIFLITVYVIFGLLLLTGVSIYLSRFIVQPAQAAIDREKQFVSDASHELKTPIASIRANAQVLQNQIAPNRYLNHILSETKRMEHLIQELLGLSKLDDKDGREHFEKVNLSSICQEMILSYESLAYEEGKLKAIGVSNFYPHVLANFCETVRVKPMVNQVELHPYFAQPEALATMKYYNVQPEAWAPLGGGRHKPFENNLLQSIADAHQKSISQVILRWNIQRGVVVIPKSTHQQRIEENFAIWDFSLTEKEMAQISSLDLGYVGESLKHFNPEFVRGCLAVKIHD